MLAKFMFKLCTLILCSSSTVSYHLFLLGVSQLFFFFSRCFHLLKLYFTNFGLEITQFKYYLKSELNICCKWYEIAEQRIWTLNIQILRVYLIHLTSSQLMNKHDIWQKLKNQTKQKTCLRKAMIHSLSIRNVNVYYK